MTALFELRNVSFDYDGVSALRDLSLQINQGERLAVLGANGSGKSTLLQLLDALQFPSSGTVSIAGSVLSEQVLRDPQFSHAFRRRVGLVFQNPDVQLFNPTVFEEVAYGPLQMGWPEPEIVRRVEEALAFMDISKLRDRPPYRLSGGEKKRVAIASVTVLDPDVLLLDEPTATLDPKSESQLVDLIQAWKGTSKTIITATHQLDIVEDIADEVVVLDGGQLISRGATSEILANEALLLKANLVHAHRHSHGSITHTHPHSHRHSHSSHECEPRD